MNIITVKNYDAMSEMAAGIIADQIALMPDSVLGLATGSTPVGAYERLVKMYEGGLVDFARVSAFNLDEYVGLDRENDQSYYYFMRDNLFSHVNILPENTHIPDGMATDIGAECEGYEAAIQAAGGIDLQLLGIGPNGHIGFNEPCDVFRNITHQVKLAQSTIDANKRFFASAEDVPKTALTMGIGTIMAARQVLVVAGANKADVIEKLGRCEVSPQIPVSILHYHPDATIIFAQAD